MIDAPNDTIKRRKGQVRPALRDAIVLIVHEGLSISDAAKSVGLARESLSKALKKPHVREAKAGIEQAWRDCETSKAWLTMAELASGAASEDVRQKCARFIIEMDLASKGRMPVEARQVVQIIAQNVTMGDQRPGLVQHSAPGVFEAEPWSPPPRMLEADYEPA